MIFIEREPKLPSAVETAKVRILAAFKTMHMVHTFDTVKELEAFLEQGLDELKAAGYPRALSRVVLFARSKEAAAVVAQRMVPGGAFYFWESPGCWLPLWKKHGSNLTEWAKRAEPDFSAELAPQGMI